MRTNVRKQSGQERRTSSPASHGRNGVKYLIFEEDNHKVMDSSSEMEAANIDNVPQTHRPTRVVHYGTRYEK